MRNIEDSNTLVFIVDVKANKLQMNQAVERLDDTHCTHDGVYMSVLHSQLVSSSAESTSLFSTRFMSGKLLYNTGSPAWGSVMT